MDATVSIIIPCYNQPDWLGEAVASAMTGRRVPEQIVIVDDGSTDATPQAIAALAERFPETITVHHQPNAGQAHAREAGLVLARGEFIVLLDADDLLEPNHLAVCLEAFACHPGADAVVGDVWLVAPDATTVLGHLKLREHPGWPAVLAYNPYGAIHGAMFRRSTIERLGGLAVPGTPGCEDWDLWVRLVRAGSEIVPTRRTIARYRQSAGNWSRGVERMLRARLELLDRAAGSDPRLAQAGVAIEPLDAQERDGYASLILAYSTGLAAAVGAPEDCQIFLLEHARSLTHWDEAGCAEQCLWGIEYGRMTLELGDGKAPPSCRELARAMAETLASHNAPKPLLNALLRAGDS